MTTPRDGGLRPIFRRHLPDLFWVPIETGAVSGGGIADHWYQAPCGASGWIEHKRAPPLRFRPGQGAFLTRIARYHGRSFVAVRVRTDELRLYAGRDALRLEAQGLDAVMPLGAWRGGLARWDWAAVRQILVA